VTPPPPPPDRRPRAVRVVIVTDPVVPADDAVARIAAVVAAVPAGSVLVQVRDKKGDGGPLVDFVKRLVATGAPVWVNDRLDVALAGGAAGVHLPEAGMGVAEARRAASITGVGIAVGCSRHTPEAALAIDGTEQPQLIQLGPVWPTPSKAGVVAPIGPLALGVRASLSDRVHLVAVGGIDSPARAAEAAASGADAVAVIRAMWTAADPARAMAAMVEAVSARRRA
jgi:thiamine-phosphate pyrophosphorylase